MWPVFQRGKTKCHTSMSLTLLFLSVLEKVILAEKGASWFNAHTQRHVLVFMYKMLFSHFILLVPLAKALRVSFFSSSSPSLSSLSSAILVVSPIHIHSTFIPSMRWGEILQRVKRENMAEHRRKEIAGDVCNCRHPSMCPGSSPAWLCAVCARS